MQVLVRVALPTKLDRSGLPYATHGERWLNAVKQYPNGYIEVDLSNGQTIIMPLRDVIRTR